MSKLEKLIAERTELENQANDLSKTESEKIFNVEIDDVRMIKTIRDHLNIGYTWTTKNAAIIVTLNDKLKTEKTRITEEIKENPEYIPVLELKGYELNGLYQALLNVTGTGVENARKFVRMLTLVGQSVTEAMQELGESNKVITDLHVKLQDLDKTIDSMQAEEVEPTLEAAGDGASN
jgi:phosphate uptake regulator